MANDLIVTDPTPVALNFDRLTKFDRSLTEAEARDVVRALDADSGKAGMAHAKTAAKLILGMYRTTEYADPQVFAAGLALTLSDFPLGVLRRVCDPRTGITGKLKFAPSVAEVKEACQAEIKNR